MCDVIPTESRQVASIEFVRDVLDVGLPGEWRTSLFTLKRRVQDAMHSWPGPSVDVRSGCRQFTCVP